MLPWTKKAKRHSADLRRKEQASDAAVAAAQAKVLRGIVAVNRQAPTVNSMAEFLSDRRARNHFGDDLTISFTRKRKA